MAILSNMDALKAEIVTKRKAIQDDVQGPSKYLRRGDVERLRVEREQKAREEAERPTPPQVSDNVRPSPSNQPLSTGANRLDPPVPPCLTQLPNPQHQIPNPRITYPTKRLSADLGSKVNPSGSLANQTANVDSAFAPWNLLRNVTRNAKAVRTISKRPLKMSKMPKSS